MNAVTDPTAPTPCDVLVIGGGPAGSTVSAFLPQMGHHVVLLEKARHPRFHIGESLLPANLPLLETLGVAEEVKAIEPDPDYVPPGVLGGYGDGSGSNGHHHSPSHGGSPVIVELESGRDTPSAIAMLREAATDHPGDRPLHLRFRLENGRVVTLEAGGRYRVSDDFLSASGIELWIV